MDQREKTFHIKPENLASVPVTHWRKEKTLSCMLNLDLLMLHTQTHTQINVVIFQKAYLVFKTKLLKKFNNF